MHVFVTGATGWVGSVVVKELLLAGHRVTGLVRSESKGQLLSTTGATALHATLDDLDTLRRAAAEADAVIHTAFDHDFSRFAEACEQDRRVIEVLGDELQGSARPFLVTAGVPQLGNSRVAIEDDLPPANPNYPRRSEDAARDLLERGVRISTIRLPPSVHGLGDHGFVPILVGIAKNTGVSAYVGDGLNRWSAVHREDAGRVYSLALEQGATEPVYHAVSEEGIALKDIAAAIGKRLGLPVESRDRDHFGWFAHFAGMNMATSSQQTRDCLGWAPTMPDLLTDLTQPDYVDATRDAASP